MKQSSEQKRIKAIKRVVREAEELTGNVATGQTIIKAAVRKMPPVMSLLERLNVQERTAVNEILQAHAILSGVVHVHDPALGIGLGGPVRPDSADASAARRVDTLDKFREWQRDLRKTNALIAVTSVLLHEVSLRAMAAENRWNHSTAFRHLRDGLRHFAALRGNVPRGEKWRLPVGKK